MFNLTIKTEPILLEIFVLSFTVHPQEVILDSLDPEEVSSFADVVLERINRRGRGLMSRCPLRGGVC